MRKEEEFCKIAFSTFLKQYYKQNEVIWTEGDEPPDYYLQLTDIKYAVDATSVWENIRINNKNTSEIGFLITIQKFLKQLEKKAKQEGILTGAYAVRYMPIDDFCKRKKIIAGRIINYIQSTRNVSSAEEEVLVGEGHIGWYIKKRHSERKYLSGGTSDAKFRGETEEDLCNLLKNTLVIKAKKLKKFTYPKILLIYNRYPWLEPKDWKKCLSKLSSIDNFHTIFLVSSKSDNLILHTIDRKWLNT